MNIVSTQFNLQYGALEIYLSGCDGICGNMCHNKELWDFTIGDSYKLVIKNILTKIQNFDNIIDNIWILGGEPLLQDIEELIDLICQLKISGKKIWLWTRFNYHCVPSEIKEICDYIKVGQYIENLKCDNNYHFGIKLATSNQKIIER